MHGLSGWHASDIKPTWRVVGDQAVWGFHRWRLHPTTSRLWAYCEVPSRAGVSPKQHEAVLLGHGRPSVLGGSLLIRRSTAVLGGPANSWSWPNPHTGLRRWVFEKVVPGLTLPGGFDFHMANYISIRLGEGSYSSLHKRPGPQHGRC
jgi:hypothetical protein